MTVTIELPPDIEAGLLAQAQGLALSEYVQNLVRDQVETRIGAAKASRPAYELPAEEWARRFEEWTESHAHLDLPVLSDEDISRESLYRERGL